MAEATKNLWPSRFDVIPELTPYDLLEAQARQLASVTEGKLTGRIDVGSIGQKVSLDFMVVAPALNGYEYRLFKVLHKVHPPFAAEFIIEDTKLATKSRQSFEVLLAKILQSATTTRLISELLDLVGKRNKGNRRKRV